MISFCNANWGQWLEEERPGRGRYRFCGEKNRAEKVSEDQALGVCAGKYNFNTGVVKGRGSEFEASMSYLERFHIQKKEGREGDVERRIKFSLG